MDKKELTEQIELAKAKCKILHNISCYRCGVFIKKGELSKEAHFCKKCTKEIHEETQKYFAELAGEKNVEKK